MKHFGTLFVLLFVAAGIAEAMNPCSAGKMWDNYNKMKSANCKNCDKYFHCQGNYEAVHKCSGVLQVFTAETISNMREWNSSNPADSAEDQKANRLGRNGGSCASEYLAKVKCAYNPATGKCGA